MARAEMPANCTAEIAARFYNLRLAKNNRIYEITKTKLHKKSGKNKSKELVFKSTNQNQQMLLRNSFVI